MFSKFSIILNSNFIRFISVCIIMRYLCQSKVFFVSLFVLSCGVILASVGVNKFVLGIIGFINSNYGYIYGGDPIVVETSSGKIKGFKSSSRDGRDTYEFLGIPYAEPPIGQLRFEPPVPIQSWSGVREARTYASKCLQFDPFIQLISGTENCLFLNVFTPKIDPVKKNPVIVFIHGGLFMFGRAEMFRPEYMMDEDVVLVSIHYRLGALGFLNTGSTDVRGNMGLKDQILALKWVQKNIRHFGGDPNSVTLLGESAGAASIHYHMMSKLTTGLFHKAVTMSGTALSHWAFVSKPKEQAEIFAAKLNCSNSDIRKMVLCLKGVPTEAIAQLFLTTPDRLAPRLSIFAPTIEVTQDSQTVITDSPRKLLQSGKIFNHVPWINGVNSDEGLIYGISMLLNQTCIDKLNTEWFKFAPILFDYEDLNPESLRNNASIEILSYYMKNQQFLYGVSTLAPFVRMFSDASFNIGNVESTNFHLNSSGTQPIYMYYYAYQSEHAIAQVYFKMLGWFPVALDALITNGCRWIYRNVFGMEETHYGVSHADELVMLFQFPYVLGSVSKYSKDYEFSKTFVKIWTTFARDGKPSNEIKGVPEWLPVKREEVFHYMKLDDNFEVISQPFTSRLKFWKDLMAYKNYNI